MLHYTHDEARRIVSNTGPLISLEKLRQGYEFIRQLYDTIIIAPGVLDAVAEGQFATPMPMCSPMASWM